MFDSSVCAPRLLNGHATLKVETLQLLFQMKHCLRMTNEHFGAAALVLCVVEAQIAHNRQTTVFRRTRPFVTDAPRFARQFLVTTQKTVVRRTIRKAGTTHFDVIQQTKIFHLMCNTRPIEFMFCFIFIRFDATNIMRTTCCKRFIQLIGLHTNFGAGGWFFVAATTRLRKQRAEQLIVGVGSDVEQIFVERVFVLLHHAFDLVHHVAGIVFDAESRAAQVKVRMATAARCAHTLHERFVGTFCHGVHRFTNIIQHEKDSWWIFSFNQITHNFVVKVWNWIPFDAFALILFLFIFQREFNENLLQFLIHIIDAHLFETVFVKDFKTENVEHTNDKTVGIFLHGSIDTNT
mmetsp:Transcript_5287/g.8740  ORF Transcript_5287/g.8740 Transcript_5287/m.8740 type:complete len:349 (-) Transcript_5287:1254-2300(-)